MRQPSKPLNYNIKDKSFHHSIEWSGLYLQVNIATWLEKIFIFIVQITGKCYCEEQLLMLCRTTPHKFARKICPPMKNFFWKSTLSHTLRGE